MSSKNFACVKSSISEVTETLIFVSFSKTPYYDLYRCEALIASRAYYVLVHYRLGSSDVAQRQISQGKFIRFTKLKRLINNKTELLNKLNSIISRFRIFF